VATALPATIDPAQVRAARDAVLALPEFDVAPDWQSRTVDAIIRWFESVSAWLPAGLRAYVLMVLLLALGALVMWLLPRATGDRPQGAASLRARPAPKLEEFTGAARAALADGRLADCVRAVWSATLVLLDHAGISRRTEVRADWEHVEAARRVRADLGPPLGTLVTAFQRSHFGARPVARDEAEACLDLLARLQAELTAHG
jgi:hypothetical protein